MMFAWVRWNKHDTSGATAALALALGERLKSLGGGEATVLCPDKLELAQNATFLAEAFSRSSVVRDDNLSIWHSESYEELQHFLRAQKLAVVVTHMQDVERAAKFFWRRFGQVGMMPQFGPFEGFFIDDAEKTVRFISHKR